MPFLQLYLYLDNSENHGHMTHVPSSLAYFEEILDEMKLQNDEPDVNYSRAGLKAGMGPEWNSETQKKTNISTITQYFFIR